MYNRTKKIIKKKGKHFTETERRFEQAGNFIVQPLNVGKHILREVNKIWK